MAGYAGTQYFFRGMITWLGYRKKQISFSVAKRRLTQSRWSFLGLFRLAVVAITAFSSLPLQAVTFMGGLFLVCASYPQVTRQSCISLGWRSQDLRQFTYSNC